MRADCPHHYRFAQVGEGEEAFAARLARQLQALIEKEGPENIAAFIAEPVIGAGGVIPPPAGYFDLIQPILKHYDILLITDEVICGFGRTGRMWGSQTYDMEPDIVTCAKALTGGYVPFSATMVPERVYEPIAEQSARIGMFGHGVTTRHSDRIASCRGALRPRRQPWLWSPSETVTELKRLFATDQGRRQIGREHGLGPARRLAPIQHVGRSLGSCFNTRARRGSSHIDSLLPAGRPTRSVPVVNERSA